MDTGRSKREIRKITK